LVYTATELDVTGWMNNSVERNYDPMPRRSSTSELIHNREK